MFIFDCRLHVLVPVHCSCTCTFYYAQMCLQSCELIVLYIDVTVSTTRSVALSPIRDLASASAARRPRTRSVALSPIRADSTAAPGVASTSPLSKRKRWSPLSNSRQVSALKQRVTALVSQVIARWCLGNCDVHACTYECVYNVHVRTFTCVNSCRYHVNRHEGCTTPTSQVDCM